MARVSVHVHAAEAPVQSDIGEQLDVSAFIAPGVGPHQVEVRIGALNDDGPVVTVDAEDAVTLGAQLLEVAGAINRYFGLDEHGNVIADRPAVRIARPR